MVRAVSRVAGRPAATYNVLIVAATSFALLQAMVIPVLPEIQRQLVTDARSVAWVVSAYLLSASVATPLIGRLGDAVGKRSMLILTLALLSAGSLLAAFAPDIRVMTAARVLQGVGGGVMPLSFGIVRDEFPPERASARLGALAALGGIGASIGLVLAGPIVDVLGYRWLFLLPMIVTAVTAVAAAGIVPPSPTRAGPVSWIPAPFLAVALAAFVLATTQATEWGWTATRTLALYAISMVAAAIWMRLESRVRFPLIDLRMMSIPAVLSGNVVSFLLGFAMFGIYAYVPQLAQAPTSTGYGFGAGVTESGLLLLPMASAVFLGGLVAAKLVQRAGSRRVVMLSSVVIAACLAVVASIHGDAHGLVAVLAIYGFALGIALAALSVLIVVAVPATQSAAAGGVNVNLRNIGGAVGTAVMATTVTAGIGEDGYPLEVGYTTGFAILAATMVVAAALAAMIPRKAVEPAE